MIEVDNLTKRFGSLTAVDGVSFCVAQGEIFGLLGPNGAGKSTTIRMLVGLANPSSGRASIGGFDCSTQRRDVHRLIGVVFEVPMMYERLSVWENLSLFARLFNVPPARLQEVIDRLGLDEVRHKWAISLSKGWRQRVLIARALLHAPQVLFLDEPTSGLDPNSAMMLREIIKELRQQNTTILLCTHDMHEADQLCDRIGFMYKGRLAALDTPQALKSGEQQKELVIEYLDDGKVLTTSYALDDPRGAELIHHKLRSQEIISINTKQLTLADIFAHITGGELS